MKAYIVVRDIDRGVHVFGVFSTNRKANDAIEKFCQQEEERLGFEGHPVYVDRKEFYLLPVDLDADCEHVA